MTAHDACPPLLWFERPYHEFLVLEAGAPPPRDDVRGAALVWRPTLPLDEPRFELVRHRPGGVALIVVLPAAAHIDNPGQVLRIVELCRPHSILPHHHEPNPHDMRILLTRTPEELPDEVTEYLLWRGIVIDLETRDLIRRTLELSEELKTISSLSRSLYMSRRALGRRFLTRGLPVPSHWLHIGRVLRAALALQSGTASLFDAACDLGYPDGFALSNQMKRLTGIRPSQAREHFGWEWVVESWLREEARTGGLAPHHVKAMDRGPGHTSPRQRRGWIKARDRRHDVPTDGVARTTAR